MWVAMCLVFASERLISNTLEEDSDWILNCRYQIGRSISELLRSLCKRSCQMLITILFRQHSPLQKYYSSFMLHTFPPLQRDGHWAMVSVKFSYIFLFFSLTISKIHWNGKHHHCTNKEQGTRQAGEGARFEHLKTLTVTFLVHHFCFSLMSIITCFWSQRIL